MENQAKDDPKPGPDPETLRIEGDWEEAMAEALKKKKPAEGWPKPQKKEKSQNRSRQ